MKAFDASSARDAVRSFCCHGGTGQYRKRAAYFVRGGGVQSGLVGKGLKTDSQKLS